MKISKKNINKIKELKIMKKFKIRYYEILLQEGIEKQVVVEKEVEADLFFIDNNCMCIFNTSLNDNVAAFSSVISVELVKEGDNNNVK
jgi:hypothetical protein